MASIERIKVDNATHFVIHNNGKRCTLTNPNSIKILLEICHKNNRYFGKTNKLENADKIIKEFDSYRSRKTNKKKKTNIMSDNIGILKDKINLVKRMPLKGKIVISTALAATIGLTAYGISNMSKKADINYVPQATIEEQEEYVDDYEIETNNPVDLTNDMAGLIVNDSVEPAVPLTISENGYIIEDNSELNKMLQEQDAFHFSYTDRTNEDSFTNAKRYEDLFIKYGEMYGVDPALLMAMAAQESSGDHYGHLSGGAAMGIMQIEKSVWLGHSVSTYNFETGETDKISITQDKLEDLETNIKIGTIILRNNLEQNNYNIALSLQSYNFGPGNMSKVIGNCSDSTGITRSDLRNNTTNPEWLNYRTTISAGDSKYIEHVFSYIPSGTILTMKDRDGNDIQLQVINDSAISYQYG